jgi:hypothetical protein
MEHERTRAARAASAARHAERERLELSRIEIEARRQLAAEIAAHHDRMRLGLIPRAYKRGKLEW